MNTEDFAVSWLRAWRGVGATGDGKAISQALLARYNEPHRKYHTIQHLAECLETFDQMSQLALHPAAVEMALWFHDAIYDLKRSDNEERSAQWANTVLRVACASSETAERVASLVMATKHACAPATPDEQVLVDIDLAILGANEQRFAEYERQIRDEYAFVPDNLFRRKRQAILQSFLQRPRIYSTAHFHMVFEQAARSNLQRAVEKRENSLMPGNPV
jgi:predicted metal-dependent HD superfamily phosphohydrolase